ncbi:MAG: hypothetical protein HQL94_03590 [Magnetococcales bacterium]|nr:hypothetical protein [Magnetococcales bacterium]
MSILQAASKNPLLHVQHLSDLLDQYDESFDLYKAYNERLLINLGELFNKTTLPISAISGDLMSRSALKKLLTEKAGFYSKLKDIECLITVRVVVYFSDDLDYAVSLIKKEFSINESHSPVVDTSDQDRFGIHIRRFAIKLLAEQYARLEYQRFDSLKAELEIRTVLQHSWSEVKGVFDFLISGARIPTENVNKLAQISYLLKMADDELVRIKDQIMSQSRLVERDTSVGVVAPIQAEESSFQESLPVDARKQSILKEKIELFILNDRVVREMDRSIADHYETRLVYKESFISILSEVFLRIGIDTEDRLREELVTNKSIILMLMENIFADRAKAYVDCIFKGSCLLVLYYLLLAKTGNVDIVKRNVGCYVSLKDMSVNEFSHYLLACYKKIGKKAPDVDW